MDSDYSNDDNEPVRAEATPSLGTLDSNPLNNNSSQAVFLPGSNPSSMVAAPNNNPKRQLAVINEIDDRKDKKKSGNVNPGKKKSK